MCLQTLKNVTFGESALPILIISIYFFIEKVLTSECREEGTSRAIYTVVVIVGYFTKESYEDRIFV